jgi:large subunit ribosomal protein L5
MSDIAPYPIKDFYQNHVRAEIKKLSDVDNVMNLPQIKKITLNIGTGPEKKSIEKALEALSLIAGQQAIKTYARKSEAGFKIREGWPIGCKVTLRGDKMYAFLDKLVSIVLPRIRDFRGLRKKSFDGQGNYSFGIKEHYVFPDIDYDKIEQMFGLDVTLTIDTKDVSLSHQLLEMLGFPFEKKQ